MPDGLRIFDRGATSELLIYEPIEPGSAKAFIDHLKGIGNKPLHLRINSPGGDVFDGLSIYNALRRHPARVTAHIDGLAASIASVICMAAGEIRIAANAFLMIHDPSALVIGSANDMSAMAQTLAMVKRSIVASYRRTGKDDHEIDALMTAETWFDAEAALAHRFVDAIDEPLQVAAHFDLSRFHQVPPALAARVTTKGNRMPTADVLPPDNAPASDDIQAIVNDPAAALAERKRVKEVIRICGSLNMPELADGYIDRGLGIEAVRADVMKRYSEKAGSATAGRPSISVGIDHDAPDALLNRMVDALASRLTGQAPSEAARPWRNHRFLDMARTLLERRGEAGIRHLSDNELAARILNSGYLTTGDLPLLLTGTGNRALLASYEAASSGLKTVSRESSAPDFRPLTRIKFGEAPELKEVVEHGEVTYGATAEAGESYAIKTYARKFAITRQAIINDDLNAFGDTLRWWGIAVAQAEATVLLNLLALNTYGGPTMSDGVALFHANHGNKAGSGTALDVANVSAGRLALRQMKGLDGLTPIGAAPRYLVVGPALETTAEQLLASLTPATVATVNPFSGKLELIVEPRLAGNKWYLFADPAQLPVLEHAFLEGQRGPQVTTEQSTDVLGVTFCCVHDFGAAAIDWRGAYYNPGT